MSAAETMPAANVTLMSLEASARQRFEEALTKWRHADRLPQFSTISHLKTASLRFVVTYHPDRLWGYEFSAPEGGLHGRFDSRESCLDALSKHTAVTA